MLDHTTTRLQTTADTTINLIFPTTTQSGGLSTMVTMFIKAKVRDYANWKPGYDEFAQKRKEKGVTAASVHRHVSDPNMVTVTHQFATLTAASAFADWEELRSAMMKGGVEGPPDSWFTEDVEQTAY
jgi:hypothetical protein